ncbi:MAG: tripartite tricarboxylate transporter substrate binding protein, partial [Betaproteobacteria bacterium]|nr:tripartite tricarboxylate transporter substrate binding protein [Betaproteobacteria bacterium]
ATARILASLMERDLGQPINVVNRVGGSGVVGHQAIASAAPDGYTLGMVTIEITMMHWMGITALKPADYTPLGLVNADPAGLSVRSDSPYKSVRELLAAIKAQPGKLKASGTGQGGIWHLAMMGLLRDQGIAVSALRWVPSQGAAPSLQDLVSGGVDVVACSIPEARALIDAGKVRPLVVMDAHPPSLYPALPTLKKEIGSDWRVPAFRIVGAPKGLPAPLRERLGAALKKAHASREFREFMGQRGFNVSWADSAASARLMTQIDADMGGLMKAVGLAK